MIWLALDTVWRLFFIQASRNGRTIDGLGFFHIMEPLVRRIAREGGDRKAAASRYTGYFNCNPLMASYIAGALTRMELDSVGEGGMDPRKVERMRDTMSSALTARGDYFVEMVLLLVSLTIGSIFAIYTWYAGPVVFLALYNLYNFRIRIGGYRTGLHLGEGTGRVLAAKLLKEQKVLGAAAAFSAGVLAALLTARAWRFGGPRIAAAGAVLATAAYFARGRISPLKTAFLLLTAAGVFLALW
jgi:mannose/fructose/N-acetylgalactosamine-specific phosphotransferase system component IID